jgi:Zn ribbon nucleic-acid-binding protein
MFDLENHIVSIPCPKCQVKNQVRLEQIKNEETIQCVGCATKIHLKDTNGSVRQATKQVQDSLDELKRTLRRFGK